MHLAMVLVYMQLIIKGGFTKIFWTLDPQHQQRNNVLNLENLIELPQNSVRRTEVIGELTIPKMPVTIAPIRTEK